MLREILSALLIIAAVAIGLMALISGIK